jgi:hypothetical protein
LGDPTLPLNLPRRVHFSADVTEMHCDPSGQRTYTVSGKLEDWESGTAWVSFVIDRMQMKDPAVTVPHSVPANERNAAYFERFTKANDKLAAQMQVPVIDGRFELELSIPSVLAPKVRWLQIYVHTDATRETDWKDGVGTQSIRLVQEQP